jgi:7-cyano-7-deazaguanine synthase
MKRAIVLLSGGLDSATALAIAKSEGYEIYAMSFLYNQRHDVEIESAKSVADALGVKEHKLVSIDLSTFGGSSLTNTTDEIPKDSVGGEESIPSTYVPARNTIFLSYALAWADAMGATDIFIGVTAVDYSGYPDCRPDYIKAYQSMANLATKVGREGGDIKIHTPLIDLSKSEIIKRGVELKVPYELTHSCYDPTESGESCGSCDSCIHRHSGFLEAGVEDPTKYANEPHLPLN